MPTLPVLALREEEVGAGALQAALPRRAGPPVPVGEDGGVPSASSERTDWKTTKKPLCVYSHNGKNLGFVITQKVKTENVSSSVLSNCLQPQGL